ncbi:cellulose biosynthesis protein BcsE [Acidovorax sp.]|uniref:cellulose biosynthesis protein BcsE n=1 Tax=Acidovorax sp. TaxID=1872122 RepID=UPI0025C1E66D|nr:cellulose biosynthesis protein BcsE [Acidovorax sp.]MBL7088714.1 cellulose biosynthesis protein BcsE [Acidovorax sp.]
MSFASASQRKSPPAPGVLRSLAMRLRPSLGTASAVQPTTTIGIADLPDGIGHLPSHVPVSLVAADSGSAAVWFPALIEDALAAGPLGLVASSTQWLDELLERPAVRAAYCSGKIKLWVLSPGMQVHVQRHGLLPLMQELERTGLLPQHALYLCDAQNLLSGLSMTQLARVSDQLSALCRQRQRPVVLAFSPPLDATALLPTLRNLCQMSMHIATLNADADRWRLNLDRWGSDMGALFQTAFGLVHDVSTHRLTADGTRTQGAIPELVTAADQWSVLATRASVEGQRGVPGHWRIVDDLEDIEVAAANSVASTVLIDAGAASDFEARARLVHQLRLSRPPTLKIVVRENLGKLRTHSEQALLHLGATVVVYKEVGFSRLLQLLQDISTQSHTRRVHPDYAQALDSFMPPRERGYQAPARFCALVRGMLDRTQGIGLSHSLVRLNMLDQIPHLDALRACHTSRDGDLFTADHEAVYVFLFACREPDVELALQRVFALPLTQLFTSQATDCSETGIRAMADQLQESLRKGVQDYSAILTAISAPAPAALVHPPAQPVAQVPADVPALPSHASAESLQPTALPLVATRLPMRLHPIGRRVVPRPLGRTST